MAAKRSSPASRQRGANQTPHGQPSHSHDKRLFTTADLLAGAPIPCRLRVNVTVRPAPTRRPPNTGKLSPEVLRSVSTRARLARYSSRVIEWAQRSTANAQLLLDDPLSAAEQAGIKLNRLDRELLRSRGLQSRPDTLMPSGVHLVGFSVSAKTEHRQEKKGGNRRG